jgi:2-haloacid dehalogenase
LRRADLTPGERLFVDDIAANIAAVRELSFHVHLFDDPAALLPALERCGLL